MKLKEKPARRRKSSSSKNNFEITGIISFLFGFFVCLSLFGYGTGIIGDFVSDGFRVLFGASALFIALCFTLLSAKYTLTGTGLDMNRKVVLLILLLVIILAGYHHLSVPLGAEMYADNLMKYGGVTGGGAVWLIRLLAGPVGTTVLLAGLLIIDLLLLTRWSVSESAKSIGSKTEKKIETVKSKIQEKQEQYQAAREAARNAGEEYHLKDFIFNKQKLQNTSLEKEEVGANENRVIDFIPDDVFNEEDIEKNEKNTEDNKEINSSAERAEKDIEKEEEVTSESVKKANYQFPPLSLLHEGTEETDRSSSSADKAVRLESTLKSFGVNAKVVHVSIGPMVTRYELEPAPGVRVSKIEGLADDIALQLAATSIRIEAPIPGKSAVGIEISNSKSTKVLLREVLESDAFRKGKGKILAALGKDIAGNTVVADLAKMPHLLIAGQTGSGKSVCINTIITSILYHSCPEDVKMILIDPKVVELSVYNGIPHLRIEVVTNPKKAAGALNWAVQEMESRYQSFSECNVRDINGFNKQNPEEKMPFIVVIIDELADLMMVAKDSVENSICRLAQKARAAGIHLVVATQRPSADVITGLIKANIPSRISFAVASQVDSRTILDKAGAEKLLGKGDMLFAPSGAPNAIRVQGAFVSDEEVEHIVNYVKTESAMQDSEPIVYDPIDLSIPEISVNNTGEEPKDELLEEVAEWMLDTKRASVSAIQRRFRIGYTRAGRLMDTMEAMGIVGPAEGAKPRELLITKEQLSDLFSSSSND